MSPIKIDGSNLSIDDVVAVARNGEEVQLTSKARNVIQRSRDWVKTIIKQGAPVYGINTGFGIFAEQRIPCDDAAKLNRNLIISHAVGTGPSLDEEIAPVENFMEEKAQDLESAEDADIYPDSHF